jgi:hypothetical protein
VVKIQILLLLIIFIFISCDVEKLAISENNETYDTIIYKDLTYRFSDSILFRCKLPPDSNYQSFLDVDSPLICDTVAQWLYGSSSGNWVRETPGRIYYWPIIDTIIEHPNSVDTIILFRKTNDSIVVYKDTVNLKYCPCFCDSFLRMHSPFIVNKDSIIQLFDTIKIISKDIAVRYEYRINNIKNYSGDSSYVYTNNLPDFMAGHSVKYSGNMSLSGYVIDAFPSGATIDSLYNWQIFVKSKYGLKDSINLSTVVLLGP